MDSAYLYVRVSTDEQKRKGFSLIEQEDRLIKYCDQNHIKINGIFREDFSAKDFNRPEWKKLIKAIKNNKRRPEGSVLFIRWDRFSRNIANAYQMIGILRDLNTQAIAIDQQIDFSVPESIVMLAFYLSVPEAENNRRSKNVSDGIRRARKMGRWPSKAPIGYTNQVSPDGKKIVIPQYPEADYIKWSFEEFAKGRHTISDVRRMANLKGLRCGRNNFWRVLHNPFYCGLVSIPATKTEEEEFVDGIHEPLISEQFFRKVQNLLNSKRINHFKQRKKPIFLFRDFLICPFCNRKLTASTSKGRHARYSYYHCLTGKCKGRFRADIVESDYENQLKITTLKPAIIELFELILEDENISTARREYIIEKKRILEDISKQELLMSKARRLFIQDKIDLDDFKDLKSEYKEVMSYLNNEMSLVKEKLLNCDLVNTEEYRLCESSIFDIYKNQDIAGKRYLIDLFTPVSINPATKELNPLQIKQGISLITTYSNLLPAVFY